ncbi:MAG: hypothetical protein ACRDYC_00265, partial [Acidimicrobiales bacterium]
LFGHHCPYPVVREKRLNPQLGEWMQGLPAGWVTDQPVPWSAQLRMIGNSVNLPCGEQVGHWIVEAEAALVAEPMEALA